MCCFSPGRRRFGRKPAPVHVADTRIFARRKGPVQVLGYAMELAATADVAMILPLPVLAGAGEEAVRFLDVSGCPTFFRHLETVFNPPSLGLALNLQPGVRPTLKVQIVGSFAASYVPTVADFSRLDPMYRLPDEVWRALGRYDDYGFAVFKLREGPRQPIHPMALEFPTRDRDRLFFPTVHVHDGEVHDTAAFDHVLYYQRDLPALRALRAEEPVYTSGWTLDEATIAAAKAHGRARGRWSDRFDQARQSLPHRCSDEVGRRCLGHVQHVHGVIYEDSTWLAATREAVEPDWHVLRFGLSGVLPNEDTWVDDRPVA